MNEQSLIRLKHQTRNGFALMIVIALSLGTWVMCAKISGAVIAPGKIAVESSVKRIQHKEGGIIQEVLVAEGDHVAKDQILVRLDATQPGANDNILLNQLAALRLRKSRLEAELSRRPWPDASIPSPETSEDRHRLELEMHLYRSRQALLSQQRQVLSAQMDQTREAVEGLASQRASLNRQYELIRSELDAVRKLNAQGYATATRVNQFERQAEDMHAQQSNNVARAAQYDAQTQALRVQIQQVQSQAQADAGNELKEVDARIAQVEQEQVMTGDIRRRAEIRSPVSGRVLGLNVHTAGGVIRAGDNIMQVVPDRDQLIVEARVNPRHIDQVRKGAIAHIRFAAFAGSLSAEATATVSTVASDVLVDDSTGEAYYPVKLILLPLGMPPAMRTKLLAGMPVDVNIETTRRPAITYLLKPLMDQISRAFVEA
jgi:HlyD family secretion protein